MPIVHVFCICCNTACQGEIILGLEGDTPDIYKTERLAQLEIVDHLKEKLTQFQEGTREFDDAVDAEWYVVEADFDPETGLVTFENQPDVQLTPASLTYVNAELASQKL